jgi:hypothetical protein
MSNRSRILQSFSEFLRELEAIPDVQIDDVSIAVSRDGTFKCSITSGIDEYGPYEANTFIQFLEELEKDIVDEMRESPESSGRSYDGVVKFLRRFKNELENTNS